jgi:hypothetical protein
LFDTVLENRALVLIVANIVQYQQRDLKSLYRLKYSVAFSGKRWRIELPMQQPGLEHNRVKAADLMCGVLTLTFIGYAEIFISPLTAHLIILENLSHS